MLQICYCLVEINLLTYLLFRLDSHGNIDRINYHNMARHSILNLAPDDVYNFYAAMRKFNDFLYDAKNVIELKLTGGKLN